jgi:eukaryotic-like serine/threonine-protein kinase
MSRFDASMWPALSAHLDHLLGLDATGQELYLGQQAAEAPSLVAALRRLLAARASEGFAGFLDVSPVLEEGIPAASLVGQQIGAYVLEEPVGSGGMGTVWRARRADGRFEGRVAVKFLHSHWADGPAVQRFRAEGRLLGRLDHPNISRLLDAGIHVSGAPYLVLEYVDGLPIDEHCARHVLDHRQRLGLFLDVLAAVAHAHGQLVVHRDLKPGNVLVTRDGQVKLLDFGIAKLLDPGSDDAVAGLTRAHVAPLTPEYAAPEQLAGRPVSTATDVYSLGVLLYLLLTGGLPSAAAGSDGVHASRVRLANALPRASSLATLPTVPARVLEGDLDNILGKALRDAPGERYPSVEAFAQDIRRHLNDQPVLARPDSLAYRSRKFLRRNRGSVIGAALFTTLLLGTLALAISQARRADQERDLARLEAQRADSVSTFLTHMLRDFSGDASPRSALGHLERARQLVHGEEYSDPIVRANLLRLLSSRYAEFGYTQQWLAMTEEARQVLATTSERAATAEIGCSLANAYDGLGRNEDSQREINAAMAVLDDPASGAGVRAIADCRIVDSYVGTARGENRRAVASATRALAEIEAAGIVSGDQHVTELNALARAHAHAGHNRQAVATLMRLRSESGETGPPADIGAWIHRFNEANDRLAGGQPLQAQTLADELSASYAQLPPDSENARDLALLRARIANALGRHADAARQLGRQALPASSELATRRAWAMAQVDSLLGLGQADAARRLWMQALAESPVPAAGGGDEAAAALRTSALVEFEAGHLDAAEVALDQAAARAVDADGAPTASLLAIELLRARLALAQRRPGEACRHAGQALAQARATSVDENSSASVGEALLARAQCEQAEGQALPARGDGREALPHLAANAGAGHALAQQARALAEETPPRPR